MFIVVCLEIPLLYATLFFLRDFLTENNSLWVVMLEDGRKLLLGHKKSFTLHINRRNPKDKKNLEQIKAIVTTNFNVTTIQCMPTRLEFFPGTFSSIEQ